MTAPRQPAEQALRDVGATSAATTQPGPAAPTPGAITAFKRHLVDALVVLVLISLVGVSWLAYSCMQDENESAQWERHTLEVRQKFGDLLSDLKEAEIGQRGFIITGKPEYLAPYHAGLAASPAHLAELRRLTADNPAQQQRLDAIAPLIAAKFATLKETIALRETQGFPAAGAALMALPGKTLMDQLRGLFAQAQAEEAQLLKVRSATTASDTRKALQSMALGGSLGVVALLLLFIRLRWELASCQRATASLRASEQRLRLATDAAELGIWNWQPEGDRTIWENERPYAIFGMARTEAPLSTARFAAEFVHPDDHTAFQQAIADTVQHGARLHFQGRFHRPDGALRWIEFTGRSEPGPGGTSLGTIGTVQDITERKQAEQLLARQAVELATLYATAPVGLFFFDTDLRYVHVNQTMAELNGMPTALHIGRTLRDLLTPELADTVELQVRQVLKTGQPLLNCEVHGATTPRPGEQQRHWLVSYYPVPAADGTLKGIQGAVKEITERRQAEQALRQRTAQFETLLNEAPVGVYLVDADLRICQANPIARQAFGNIPDLIGSDCDVLLHLAWPAAVADEQVRLFRHTLDTGEPYVSCDFSWQRFDRNVTEYYDWQINRIALPDGGYGVVCYFRDISERVVAQQKIRESEERFRSILHQSPAGIVQTDATGCLTLMNDRWCQMLGYPQAEMVGRSVLEFTHPSSVEATATAFGALAAGGPDFQIDKHYSRKDGTILAAQSNVSAIRSPSGDFLGIIAVVMDMSERLRFEDALRQSEERLRAFVTASSDAVYRMSPDWREMHKLHGQNFIADTPALNANWLQEYIHPDDHQRVLAAIDQAIQSKSLFELEHQVVTVDGTLGWTCSRAVPMLDANGEIIEWFGTASDVTEHKRAQGNLRLSEDRLKIAAAAGRVGIWDWNLQINELIWDDAMLTLYGARREEFSGAYDAWSNRLNPDDKAASEAAMQDALAGKKDLALEFSVVWPDGSVHHLIASARVVRDEAGKPRRVVGTNVDVTERKQAEQALERLNATLELRVQERTAELSQANADLQAEMAAKDRLRESEERLVTVAENLNEGLVITTMKGELIHWNRASLEMHGFASLPECLEQLADFTQLFECITLDGEIVPLDQWPMSRVLRGEVVRNAELRIRRTDTGVERLLSYSGSSVCDSAGKQSVFLTVTDIAERKRAGAKLHELNHTLERRVLERTQALADLDQRKDEFLAMLAHELRNPLAPIITAADLLSMGQPDEKRVRQLSEVISRQSGHMTRLIDDLLDVSRVTRGLVTLNRQPLDMNSLLSEAIEQVRPLLEAKAHYLQVQHLPQRVLVNADKMRLVQVLANVLNNAIKYTPDGGQIELRLETDDSQAILSVRDNGMGMSAELLERAFELFAQGQRSIDRTQGGLGIGLALVKSLVQLHGGTVAARSEGAGRGSEFRIFLPRLPDKQAPHSPADDQSGAGAASTALRILVVDDNVDAAQLMGMLLEMLGHQVTVEYSSAKALDSAARLMPQICLLDIGLPNMDGYELARQLRRIPGMEGTVLAAVTGYGQPQDRKAAFTVGFNFHFAKPVDTKTLQEWLTSTAAQLLTKS